MKFFRWRIPTPEPPVHDTPPVERYYAVPFHAGTVQLLKPGHDQQPYPKFKEIDRDTYNALRRFRNRAAKDDKKGRA